MLHTARNGAHRADIPRILAEGLATCLPYTMNQYHGGEEEERAPLPVAPPIPQAGVGYYNTAADDSYAAQSYLYSPADELHGGQEMYIQDDRAGSTLTDPELRSPLTSDPHYGSQYDNLSYGGYTPVIGRVPSQSQGDFVTTASTDAYQKGPAFESMASLPRPAPVDPFSWMTSADIREPDDDLHDPSKPLRAGARSPTRAFINLGTMLIVVLAMLMLFVGYPVLHRYTDQAEEEKRQALLSKGRESKDPAYADRNSVRWANGHRNVLIDPDTPPDAYTRASTYGPNKNKTMHLVFSDEFETPGRSFYPGDDPFWEAVDLNYWGTNNYEWYDPEAITTRDGYLEIKLERHEEHNLNFRGGMLQSWNKFCFTGGLLIASIQLPGKHDVGGLWPAFWIMGNLGRAGYGASLEGTWPYSYDQCDVGTVINQTLYNSTNKSPDTEFPVNMSVAGDVGFNAKHESRSLSFLTGQKLSACTCKGDDHPGPWDEERNTYVGRAAPEIDVFEAQVQKGQMGVSQTLQMAPFNYLYDYMAPMPNNHSTTINQSLAFSSYSPNFSLSLYTGELRQQAISGSAPASQVAVQADAPKDRNDRDSFATYSLEFKPGEDGYVSWTSNGRRTWELHPGALDPDPRTKLGRRTFPEEPMYIILNLGISKNFGDVSWGKLKGLWNEYGSLRMLVDWVRVYQDPDMISDQSVTCDPKNRPTKEYIERHMDAYQNANLTIWGEGGYNETWPRNRLYGSGKGCQSPAMKNPGDNVVTPRYVEASHYPSASLGHHNDLLEWDPSKRYYEGKGIMGPQW